MLLYKPLYVHMEAALRTCGGLHRWRPHIEEASYKGLLYKPLYVHMEASLRTCGGFT